MPPRTRRSSAAAAEPAEKALAPAEAAPSSPVRRVQVTLHAWAKAHKYDATGCPIYTPMEVVGDSLVHFIGVPFAFWASAKSLGAAHARLAAGGVSEAEQLRTALGLRVYLFGLCLMLTASAVYNVIGCGMKHHTQFLRRIDHGCIYVMIAGSYTPLMLHLPAGAISSRIDNDTVLKGIWAVALTGSALKIILARRFETAGLLLYVCLGCTVISFTHAVTEGFPGGGALLMEFVKSGACYLFGLIFYLGDEIPFSNALWHSCVLAGAATHWVIVHHLIALGEVGYPH